MLTVLVGLAEFERERIRIRTGKGRSSAGSTRATIAIDGRQKA
jgi:hypothetical protein